MSASNSYDNYIKYESIEEEVRQKALTRQQRRKPKPKQPRVRTKEVIIAELTDTLKLENAFDFTYTPAEHEAGWVLAALQSFFHEELITDVMALVKGGKEANVYQCRAHPSVGVEFVAAKIYRPKMHRQLSNDAMYKEGRAIIGETGNKSITARNKREMRAIKHKSNYGDHLTHRSWLHHEFNSLQLMHEFGASVPKPYAIANNAILMDFIGDADGAAPILHSVNLKKLLPKGEVDTLFRKTIDTVELMLQHDGIHGDLSAFNILFWNGDIVLIDFPQVTVASANRRARYILERDVQRVCDYFAKQGIDCDPRRISNGLWQRYVALSDADRAADESRYIAKGETIEE